jgi:hypothetical protein
VIVPDVNLLLYAEVDAFPQHAKARAWWEQTLNGQRAVGLPAVAVFGFVRISTHRKVFDRPMTVSDALGRVRAWMARPRVTLLSPGPGYLELALQLLEASGASGNLTTDAQIAAHAIEVNGEVCSNDADFARFAGLRWRNPLAD